MTAVRAGGTVAAERELRARLRRGARDVLGPGATDREVDQLASEWYEDRPPEPPEETPFERREREAETEKAKADVERYVAAHGTPWSSDPA